jgi:uncharacterized protein (DUF58 family)
MTRGLNWLLAVALVLALWLRDPLIGLLALLLALLAGVTWLWERYALAGVTYERRLRAQQLFVGDETELVVEITNAKPLSLPWLRAEDEFPAEIALARGRLYNSNKTNRRLLTNLLALRFYERVRKQYHLRAAKRGVLVFGPVRLRAGDLFGFRRQERWLEQCNEVVVYPRVVPWDALPLPAGYPFGDSLALRRIVDDPLRVTGARPYAPGDNPRYLHWKATARRGALQTRTFEPGATPRTAIFLDVQTIRGAPGTIEAYLEYAIVVAASLARCLLDRREAVGLYANALLRNSRDLLRLPASRHPDHWRSILEALARTIDLPRMPLWRLLASEMPALPYGAAVVAISAVPDAATYAALLDMQRAGHPTFLLAIGDSAPEDVPGALACAWLGGRDAYAALAAQEQQA